MTNMVYILTVTSTRPLHGGKVTTQDRRLAVLDEVEARMLFHATENRYHNEKGFTELKSVESGGPCNKRVVRGTHVDHEDPEYAFVEIDLTPVRVYQGV